MGTDAAGWGLMVGEMGTAPDAWGRVEEAGWEASTKSTGRSEASLLVYTEGE